MASEISTITNRDDTTTILIKYGNQSKPISVKETDDLFSIEARVYTRFKFNSEQIKNLQLQYYDDDLKEFIDLDSETWPTYSKYLEQEKNKVTSGTGQHLKLVHKQLFQDHSNPEEQLQMELNYTQNDVVSSLNDTYTVIDKMPADHTSGITEHRIGSQTEHMNQSIHTDWVLNGLGWLLPLVSVLAFAGDGIWLNSVFDPSSEEQHNYAGLTSTLLILFYYLQYDVKISSSHPKLYLVYQSILLILVLGGDVLHAFYYGHYVHDKFLMIIFIFYGVIDSIFVFFIGYLKFYREYRVSMGLSIHNLFHLMSRLEVLLIILIPIFTTYDVISTNSIAFFILYEFFSHSYNNPDLIYSGSSRLSFWLLIIFATLTVLFENVEFVYDQRAQDAEVTHNTTTAEYNYKMARAFLYTSNLMEIIASIACYALLILQFFSKSDKQKRKTSKTLQIQSD